ncbi:MAG TPA: UDP-N-acetylmuramoyl-L-alanyl-D-glutamate--2,6-diaminopimelate ligase [Candidatus Babeliales bacterium]|nr:UDP-N-acetylmuramoyl-L-alanyl-D-glutamate--2,6-diaminopimelate ligase [Candidatus Babeliales bacterium]
MTVKRRIALTALLSRLPEARITGDRQVEIEAIAIDSRAVEPGALFVALRGSHSDGHAYLQQAVTNGARAVVTESTPNAIPAGVTAVRVADSRRALSALAAAYYGDPSQDLDVIGITGTNGKTTTAHMVAAILDAAGTRCGVIGTVGAQFGGRRWRLENTTPLPPELHRLLAEMRDEGAKAVAMEVSSHALALERIADVKFRIAVLTNVGRDHLDFHGSHEAYAQTKRRLFSLAPACVLNVDDYCGQAWARELRDEGRVVVTYGLSDAAMIRADALAVDAAGSKFCVDGRPYELALAGRFNVYNALAAIGVAQLLGIDGATAARGLAKLPSVPGRMERLAAGGIEVVVDYAHTPDALENALRSLRETAGGAVAVVFGCGGDRDRGKRSQMGAVAARLADRLYVTSDNPRSEAPQAIADAILEGIGDRERVVELDRRRAIERAIAEAAAGDVVLVAGKGHETYQIVGNAVLPFDDAEIARETLEARTALK